MRESRRVKLAFVRPDSIVNVFIYRGTGFPFRNDPGSVNQLERLKLRGVPEGTRVVHGGYDYPRAAFGLVLEHESFDEVPFGAEPPHVEVDVDLIQCDCSGNYVRTLRRSDDPCAPDAAVVHEEPGRSFDEPSDVVPSLVADYPISKSTGERGILHEINEGGGWRDRPALL